MSKYLYFLIEGGKTLELCKAHINERLEVLSEQQAMLAELGDVEWSQSPIDGRVWGVRFKDGNRHPDFTAPNKHGVCGPKKRSAWAAKFKEARGWDRGCYRVAEALGVPSFIEYEHDGGHGSMVASPTFDAGVGFLWCDQDVGPYGLWLYDIAGRISDFKAKGYAIEEPANSWVPTFDGARPIHEAEWDLIVAQHKVAQLQSDQLKEAA